MRHLLIASLAFAAFAAPPVEAPSAYTTTPRPAVSLDGDLVTGADITAYHSVTFADATVLAAAIQARPGEAVEALASILTPKQADEFYSTMVPAATPEDIRRLDRLRAAHVALVEAGAAETAASVEADIQALEATLAAEK